MRSSEIRELSKEEITSRLANSHEELFNLRFQLAVKQLSNFRRIREVRGDIARMETELRMREIKETGNVSAS
jgi:large subunit ribosomal protein L29